VGSALLAAGLFTAHYYLGSDLSLAQAADSLLDFGGALVLAYAVRVARTPGDAGHPFGHTRAEPLGALGIAMLASLLGFEVGTSALGSLLRGSEARPGGILLGLFLAKVAFKGVVFLLARGRSGPALEALAVDAKNDILVGLLAVAGYFLARAGWHAADAWLSLPVAAYIGYSGYHLARTNVDRLMGSAPSVERQADLRALAAAVSGVLEVHDLRAHYLGTEISLHVHIVVLESLTIREASEIGAAVRARLEAEPDVIHASVHIDPQAPAQAGKGGSTDGTALAKRSAK
jgi:cation diffusion facilitator family transporter